MQRRIFVDCAGVRFIMEDHKVDQGRLKMEQLFSLYKRQIALKILKYLEKHDLIMQIN